MSSKLFCIFLLLQVIVVFTKRDENVNLRCNSIGQNHRRNDNLNSGDYECKFFWRIASDVSYPSLTMASMQSAFNVWQSRANVSFHSTDNSEAITIFFNETYNCAHTQVTPRTNVCIHSTPNSHHIADIYFNDIDKYYFKKHGPGKNFRTWIMEDAIFLIGRVLNYTETQIQDVFNKYSSEH